MATATLTIDGREVTVPAGTGLVEAAEQIGIEIPVFCYEPRIGPAVGACRMCLVEIEGVPKLQAACATSVRDGMVVSSVGEKARVAQEAVLEFLLVNHPLDCPVCDKGGECPLQDQAFRWGPGTSRFAEQKRVNDKPIPISPLIALDRERCILCYRCSRFSAEVTEDLQLIARQRGARSVIATFEGRAWDGHNTGNVIELCPVGALTSTQYRFHGRPWETTDHPSIAPWDPVGTNVFNSVREGAVVRVISRRNDAVDGGWIDDRTRFAYTAMYGASRILAPQHRPLRERPVGNRPVIETSHEVAMEWLHERLASTSGERELWVLGGGETLEVVHAIQQIAKTTGGRVVAIPGASAAVPEAIGEIADISRADNILVIGDADLLDTAPALDLRIRKARQRGAVVVVAGAGGTRLEQIATEHVFVAPGRLDEYAAGPPGAGTPEQVSVAVYRDGDLSDDSVAKLAGAGFRLLAISGTANARGLAALDVPVAAWDEILSHTGGVVYSGVDPERHVDISEWGPSIKRAAWVVAIDSLPTPLHASVDMVIPAAWGGEQDGTLVNLEGRLQRMTVGAGTPGEVVPQLRWLAGLARRLGAGAVSGHAAGAYRALAAATGDRLPAATHGDIPAEGVLGVTGGPAPRFAPDAAPNVAAGELALYVAPSLFDSAEVAHADAMGFLTDKTKLVVNRDDARALELRTGDHARLELDASTSVEVVVTTSRRMPAGHARTSAGTPGFAAGRTGWRAARLHASAHAAASSTVAAATTADDDSDTQVGEG